MVPLGILLRRFVESLFVSAPHPSPVLSEFVRVWGHGGSLTPPQPKLVLYLVAPIYIRRCWCRPLLNVDLHVMNVLSWHVLVCLRSLAWLGESRITESNDASVLAARGRAWASHGSRQFGIVVAMSCNNDGMSVSMLNAKGRFQCQQEN